jgi:hypothetical protein
MRGRPASALPGRSVNRSELSDLFDSKWKRVSNLRTFATDVSSAEGKRWIVWVYQKDSPNGLFFNLIPKNGTAWHVDGQIGIVAEPDSFLSVLNRLGFDSTAYVLQTAP